MTIETMRLGNSAMEVVAYGKLSKQDYDLFTSQIESALASKDTLNLLLHIRELDGWSPRALWEDLQFDIKHYDDFSRIALVGEKGPQEWMARASKPLTTAEVKFFEVTEADEARKWVQQAP